MSKITKLDDYRQHISAIDPVTKRTHIMPLSLVDDICAQRIRIDQVECHEEVTRALLFTFIICGDVDE